MVLSGTRKLSFINETNTFSKIVIKGSTIDHKDVNTLFFSAQLFMIRIRKEKAKVYDSLTSKLAVQSRQFLFRDGILYLLH